MKYRTMDKLGVSPSLLGFGCMRFPKKEDGTIDEAEAERMLDHAIQSGVNYIDTAYPYHGGKSEPFVGRVLKKYNREDFYLATKLPIWNINSLEEAKEIFESQLKRLDVDYVDFYLLHGLDKTKFEKVLDLHILDYLEDMREAGKIRFIGFSFHDDYDAFKEILDYRDWDFCQIQFNYVDTEIQAGMKGYELAEKRNVPLVIMEPVKGGSLSVLPADIAKKFKDVNPDASISSWALRYVGSLPNVKVVLSGMSTYEQVEDNLATFGDFKELNESELLLIQDVAKAIKAKVKNGCTGCSYCMPCPFGVDIPKNFRIWNEYAMYGNKANTKQRLASLEGFGDMCKKCGKCETLCPQSLPIRDDLEKVVAELKNL